MFNQLTTNTLTKSFPSEQELEVALLITSGLTGDGKGFDADPEVSFGALSITYLALATQLDLGLLFSFLNFYGIVFQESDQSTSRSSGELSFIRSLLFILERPGIPLELDSVSTTFIISKAPGASARALRLKVYQYLFGSSVNSVEDSQEMAELALFQSLSLPSRGTSSSDQVEVGSALPGSLVARPPAMFNWNQQNYIDADIQLFENSLWIDHFIQLSLNWQYGDPKLAIKALEDEFNSGFVVNPEGLVNISTRDQINTAEYYHELSPIQNEVRSGFCVSSEGVIEYSTGKIKAAGRRNLTNLLLPLEDAVEGGFVMNTDGVVQFSTEKILEANEYQSQVRGNVVVGLEGEVLSRAE